MNIHTIGASLRDASRALALLNTEEKNRALRCIAKTVQAHSASILEANAIDMNLAREKQKPESFLDRLRLDDERITAMTESVNRIADLPDPVGNILRTIQRPNGLRIERISVPLGVIGVIFESRPNVTLDAAALCFKSGNAVLLRSGSESFHSAKAIVSAIHTALHQSGIDPHMIQLLESKERSAVDAMLKMDKYIDVIVPRGGMQLIEYVSTHTNIPVFKHLAGICHTYLHEQANLDMARAIILNAKMRRTGICGATEVLLVDESILSSHLPAILEDLQNAGCEIRGDERIVKLNTKVKPAEPNDFDTEFLAPILAVKTVKNVYEAISHIQQHSTQHTDAIITDDEKIAACFLNEIDSAIVMHNASTQFADGGEFGMGAEIGIATGKLHARGPVGVEQLTTFKYVVHGSGQVRG